MSRHRKNRGADQKSINRTEWSNPDNWGGPRWISVYFSKKDSRTWVPKQIPWMGWTLNLAKTSGVLTFLFIIIGLFTIPLVTTIVVLG
ncbi:MAG: DUF5808 domain-containing protein [Lysobacterales bacterium]|jgi:uncharacterized membrane protein